MVVMRVRVIVARMVVTMRVSLVGVGVSVIVRHTHGLRAARTNIK